MLPADLKWLEAIFTPGALVAVIVIVGLIFLIKKIWKPLSNFFAFWRKLLGHEANPALGEEASPGLFAQMNSLAASIDEIRKHQVGQDARDERIEQDIATIRYETTPNHGGSMKDSQRRTEEKVDALSQTVLPLLERIKADTGTPAIVQLEIVEEDNAKPNSPS